MNDIVIALAERLQAVVDDATYSDNYKVVVGERLAHEALAFVAERLPTARPTELLIRHAIGRWSKDGNEDLEDLVDILRDALLRDLRERLGVEG